MSWPHAPIGSTRKSTTQNHGQLSPTQNDVVERNTRVAQESENESGSLPHRGSSPMLLPAAAPEEWQEEETFASSLPAGRAQRVLALFVIAASAVFFAIALPFVRVPLIQIPSFIASYESALATIDLITAILLFGQASRSGSRALLVLACGYLFNALITVAHALTFPGLFSPTGLLGAGNQSTAWLYAFWHGGFPLFVMGYVLLELREYRAPAIRRDTAAMLAVSVLLVIGVVSALTMLATDGMHLLPVIIQGGDYTLLVKRGVSPAIVLLSLLSLILLYRATQHTVLDIWLMVVMGIWLLDVALSAVISSSRYDLGWYAGRSYGLLAASFVLGVLLVETYGLQVRLAAAKAQLADKARRLEQRVDERTLELRTSNETLREEVSNRKNAEQELRNTRSFLDVIIESVPAVLFVKDVRDGKCLYLNRAGEQLLGCDRTEIIGKTAHDIMSKSEADLAANQDGQARSADHATHESSISTRQGVRLVRTKKVPVPDEQGNPKYILGFSEDVTEQRQTEDQLRQAQKMETLGQLTGGLAHDFNNLLAVIIGNLDVLSEMWKNDPDREELVQAALDAALSGAELTKCLLAFARRQPLNPEHVDVNELIADISKLLARTLGENIHVSLDLDPMTESVVVDRVQLETAITNLANNARDAMPNGGSVMISTRNGHLDAEYAAQHKEVMPGNYVVIEMSDVGAGIPAEVLDRIFEPFFTTKGMGKGTGLGLSMVFGFVKQSGGHINVYSELGRGTTFRLYLPPARPEAVADPLEAPPTQPMVPTAETILVVEDNPRLRKVVEKQLVSLGYKVFAVEDAEAAFELLKSSEKIDLLFTDVVLPGPLDGRALAQEVGVQHPTVKVLLTSGFPGTRLNLDGVATPNRLLSKPYRKEELARAIGEALKPCSQVALTS